MDEKISSVVTIGDPDIVEFSFSLRETGLPRDARAWGEGRVTIGSVPVWYVENEDGSEGPLEWSWLDLLDFLAGSWPWLLNEQRYPVAFDTPPLHPGVMWQELKRRWDSVPAVTRKTEERRIKEFLSRHDLSLGLRGVYLPQIFILRQGNECFVYSDEVAGFLHNHGSVIKILDEVGDYIASWVLKYVNLYDDRYAATVLARWDSKVSYADELYVQASTGLDNEDIQRIVGGDSVQEFFEIDGEECCSEVDPNELLSAARMSKGYVAISKLDDLLGHIKGISFKPTPKLDVISARIGNEWEREEKAWDQGYAIAARFVEIMDHHPAKAFDPAAVLQSWGVEIRSIDLETDNIDAVAIWGKRHGPAVLVNSQGERARHIHGLRTTLAHEICHLLVDRGRALPVADVLGGATPLFVEQRAGAFAAELLLPRDGAARTARTSQSITEALYELREGYKVSRKVAAFQIMNSSLFPALREDEQQYLINFTAGGWRRHAVQDE
jgi:Zn-dependent peptidase ImmA (M78 family)